MILSLPALSTFAKLTGAPQTIHFLSMGAPQLMHILFGLLLNAKMPQSNSLLTSDCLYLRFVSGEQPRGESSSSTPRRVKPQAARPVYQYTRLSGGGAVPASSIQEDDDMKERHPELYAEPQKRHLTQAEIDAGNRALEEAEVGAHHDLMFNN